MIPKDRYGQELTPHQSCVLGLVAQGLDVPQAAKILKKSHHTITSHLREVHKKTGLSGRVSLVHYVYALRANATPEPIRTELLRIIAEVSGQ